MSEDQQASYPTGIFDNEVWTHPDLELPLALTSMAVLAWWVVSLLLGPIALASQRSRSARSDHWWLEEDGL